MVIFRLLRTNFEKYEIDKEETITINFEHFNDALKRCPDNEKISLTVENNKFKIKTLGKNPKEYELSLIDFVDKNLQKIPELKFDVKVVMPSIALTDAITDLSFIEEGIDFVIQDKTFVIEGKTPTRAGKRIFKDDVDITCEKELIKSKYTINYLKKFIKGDKLTNTVELSFSDDYPLKIEYKVIDRVLLGFILAPRGED